VYLQLIHTNNINIIKSIYIFKFSDSLQSTAGSTNAADNAKALEIIFIIEVVWIGLSVIAFICIFNKIRLAIGIIKTATLYVRDNFSVMIVPPVIGIILGGFWVWWIVSVV
jgi:succinate dehydrogenase/fumarate reductase cytochrome b subunit